MLARAAARSFRAHTQPVFLRAALPYTHPRAYAKPGKPKIPTDSKSPTLSPPVDKHAPSAQELWGSAQTAAPPQDRSDQAKDLGSLRDEAIASRADSESNIEPRPPGAGPVTPPVNAAEAASHPDHSKLQDEFQISPESDANTAPQSISPTGIDSDKVQKQRRSQPLPDLTQGIPSTLDAELAGRDATSKAASLNVTEDPSETAPGGGAGGDLPKTAYISSLERRRNRLANWMYAILFGSAFVGTVYLGRNWETEEQEMKHPDAPSGWGFSLFYNRANARLSEAMNYFNEPTFPKLLPNVDPAWERPYTLVLSLEDLLVHSEWTREHGWRMAKRPGVDYFLRYLSQYYELVIFTSLPSMTGDSIVRKLDPYRIIMWPLFREATRYKSGEYIKVCPMA